MGKMFRWDPEYCQYDVCACGHSFCEHGKVCNNSGYWDIEKEVVVPTDRCTCKKFKFKHSEIMRKPR